MPYRKSYRARATRDRRAAYVSGTGKRRAATVARSRMAQDLANLAVRGLNMGPGEFKSVDVNGVVSADQAGAVLLLNGIARGDDINERTGREVTLKSIQIRAVAYGTPGTGIDQVHRVMIVYDRQTNAAALTSAMVLNSVAYLSHRNLENRKRFTVLYDKLVTLNATGESGTIRGLSFYRHLNHPEEFNSGDAGTVADITTGSIYVVVVGSVAAGVSAGGVNIFSRIRYQDK